MEPLTFLIYASSETARDVSEVAAAKASENEPEVSTEVIPEDISATAEVSEMASPTVTAAESKSDRYEYAKRCVNIVIPSS